MKPNDRRCVSCRKVAPKQEFWRVVRVHSAQQPLSSVVQLDHGMGRSAYLCPQATCLQLAQKKDRLGRALKASVADQLYKTLWQRLTDLQPILSARADEPSLEKHDHHKTERPQAQSASSLEPSRVVAELEKDNFAQ